MSGPPPTPVAGAGGDISSPGPSISPTQKRKREEDGTVAPGSLPSPKPDHQSQDQPSGMETILPSSAPAIMSGQPPTPVGAAGGAISSPDPLISPTQKRKREEVATVSPVSLPSPKPHHESRDQPSRKETLLFLPVSVLLSKNPPIQPVTWDPWLNRNPRAEKLEELEELKKLEEGGVNVHGIPDAESKEDYPDVKNTEIGEGGVNVHGFPDVKNTKIEDEGVNVQGFPDAENKEDYSDVKNTEIGGGVNVQGFPDAENQEYYPDVKNTEIGYWIADGCVQEVFTAYNQGKSWDGGLEESDIFASEIGRMVQICKEPEKPASIWGLLLDLHKLVKCLFYKYWLGHGNKAPPFLYDFEYRIVTLWDKKDKMDKKYAKLSNSKKIKWDKEKKGQWDKEERLSLRMLQNHPFVIKPHKIKASFDVFYSFYKSFPSLERRSEMYERNTNVCKNWHIERVRMNQFLYMVYWSKRDIVPDDYLTREDASFRDGDDEFPKYPYTPADGYLAQFIRTCCIHGSEIVNARWCGYCAYLEQILDIVFHCFVDFVPPFIEEMMGNNDAIVYEGVKAYMAREIRSWRALSAHNFTPPDSAN